MPNYRETKHHYQFLFGHKWGHMYLSHITLSVQFQVVILHVSLQTNVWCSGSEWFHLVWFSPDIFKEICGIGMRLFLFNKCNILDGNTARAIANLIHALKPHPYLSNT